MRVADERRRVPRCERVCLIRTDGGRVIRRVLHRIANKWSLLVIATLHGERMRFTELQRHIPSVSQGMLSLTLRHLERDGLVSRTAYAEVPPRVEYELTELGRTLIDSALRLAEPAIGHDPDIGKSQGDYDVRRG